MLVPSTLGLSFGKSDELLGIPKSTKPAKIDGMWSTETEWIDASETKIVENRLTAYLRAKYDERFVYILIDFISDQSLDRSGDWAVVCFDTKSDSGKTPLADDYCFYRATRAGDFRSGIMQGNGKGWTIIEEAEVINEFRARMRYSHLNDPYESKDNHMSYELKIPIGSYDLNEKMKFYVYVNDGYYNNFVEWPTNVGGKQFAFSSPTIKDVLAAPNNWGNLLLMPSSAADMQDERPKSPIDVATDKTEYYAGEVVNIEGCVPTLTNGHEVNVIVKDANGETFTKLRIQPKDDNKFAASFQLPHYDKLFSAGRWTINIGYAIWAAKVDINVLASETRAAHSVTISKPELLTLAPTGDVRVGDKVMVISEVKNNQERDQTIFYIVQIKDDLGTTVLLDWLTRTLNAKEAVKFSITWMPELEGEYNLETFVWDNISNPTPLSSSQSVDLTVA